MKIIDENCCILFCKRAFSDVVESISSKNLSGGRPKNGMETLASADYVKFMLEI